MEAITAYLDNVEKALRRGDATEHTHRPALKTLLEELAPGVTATNEPKRSECGAPDYVVSRDTPHGPLTIGYAEAKDVGLSLDDAGKSEQLRRYRAALPSLLLTDYLEFRWYVEGECRGAARLARAARDGKLEAEKDGEKTAAALLQGFLAHRPADVSKPHDLARRMARLTHMVRDIIVVTFERQQASHSLQDMRAAFAKALIPDLDQPKKTAEFADMFAQTIAYGLFAARCNHAPGGSFRRLGAAAEIPKTNPFLRTLFNTVTGPELDDEPFAGFVDDLVSLLNHTDMAAVLEQFGKRTRQEDPVVHFYETFLAAYDPRLREARGVYYTPEPVVSYIVRSVDHLLKTRFACAAGLAESGTVAYEQEVEVGNKIEKRTKTSPRVLILDPACGTGTFLYAVVDHIREQFMKQESAGMWSGFVRNHLLPRIFGFELLVAPYAVAHLKLGMQLAGLDLPEAQRRQWKYDFAGDERLGVYLTNTLEEAERKVEGLFGPLRVITDEANGAAAIKRDLPIMVVMGNPPYSGHSANASWRCDEHGKNVPTFSGRLVQDYYHVDGKPLGERNPKWLQDDYVKFIRWGTWRIERTGAGILAFITNHGYLDNPTFRGMRQQLLRTFDEVYVLDLHGNAKKRERAPDGSEDQNVFDIQQGVALCLLVKLPGSKHPRAASHAELYGSRDAKYKALQRHDVANTTWTGLKPQTPLYLFKPQNVKLRAEYEKGWKITDVMPVSSVGVVTARDALTVHFTPDDVWRTVRDFAKLQPEQARERYGLPDDAKDWAVRAAQEDLHASGPAREQVTAILYRPFDTRHTYYTGRSRGFLCRPRAEIMCHMLAGANRGLIATRQTRDSWDVSATKTIVGHKTCAAFDINTLFPLYLYPDGRVPETLFDHENGRRPNLSARFIAAVSSRLKLSFVADGTGDLGRTFGPEDVFHYIYAVLHSPTYRERYGEFLKLDFPRVPLTTDRKLFRKLCASGAELVSFHLLENETLANIPLRTAKVGRHLRVNYPIAGDSEIAKGHPRYLAPGARDPQTGKPLKTGRVYISGDDAKTKKQGQYFEGVPPEVWEFHIGGYQVCEKWLKDRRGRQLSYDDLAHYQKVVVALKETIRLMRDIDAAIPHWPIT